MNKDMASPKKLFLLFFLLLLLFAIAADFAFARELEVTYPTVGNVPAPSSTRTLLPDYVKYIFNFAVSISGMVVLAVIFYAGFRYLTSAGNPTVMADSKNHIFEALIGLIIILGSYLLLTTINPQLIIINPILSSQQGVVVYKASGCPGKGSPESKESLKPERDYIRFGVSSRSLEGLNQQVRSIWLYKPTSDLEVKVYPGEDWQGAATLIETDKAGCIEHSALATAQSIELNWQNPGVYLCKDAEGKECSIYNSSQAKLADGFEDEVQYIKFKHSYTYDNTLSPEECAKKPGGKIFNIDSEGNLLEKPACFYYTALYGAVLHEDRDFEGTCNIFSDEGNVSLPKGKPSSITVFLRALEPEEGAEVILCKYKDCLGAQCSTPNCDDIVNITEGASTILRYGTGVPERPQGIYYSPTGDDKFPNFTQLEWQNPNIDDENINDEVAAIKVKGNLKVIMFRGPEFKNECEVLTTDYDTDLENNSVTCKQGTGKSCLTSSDTISSLQIIPVKK